MAVTTDLATLVAKRLDESAKALTTLNTLAPELARIIEVFRRAVLQGSRILTCGNGGSAAEAMHLAEELVGRYKSNRAPIGALCLNADPTALTCIANDFGFDEVFARQLTALGQSGDWLVVFSTSGKSPNILRVLEEARSRNVTSLALLGGEGGPAASRADHTIIVRGVDGAAVQEAHQAILHMMCESLEPV